MIKDKHTCCICGKEFEGYGNNPAPYPGDICCDECNKAVITIRAFLSGMIKGALILHSNDGVTLREPKNKLTHKFSIDELQDMVGGHFAHHPLTNVTSHYEKLIFMVNEEGLLLHMNPNSLAFQMFNLQIVGPLVIVNKDCLEED